MNESLYPPRGGLGEFYVWDDDYDKRIDLNEPIDKAKINYMGNFDERLILSR